MNKKFIGFTLAEILISLAIVGVIASLTIPALLISYKPKLYAAQLRKIYSQLSTATKEIISEEHADSISLEFGDENYENTDTARGFYYTTAGTVDGGPDFLKKYFKNSKVDCGAGKSNSCMASSYKSKNDQEIGAIDEDYFCVQTVNGQSICTKFDENYEWIDTLGKPQTGATKIVVDINGLKKPNVTGEDLFVMRIDDEGNVADIDSDETKCNVQQSSLTGIEQYASGCLAKVMNNGWK